MICNIRIAPVAALLLAAGALLAACGGGGDSKSAEADCRDVEAPAPTDVLKRKAPKGRLDTKKSYTATVKTSCGTFTIKLDSKDAPKTGASFVYLARSGFYDGLTFHRIAPGFVIQGGDPNGNGTGDAGYKVREKPSQDLVYSQGTVAMAKAGNEPPGTSGSQFFVATADTDLPPEYALLGKVTQGMAVVKAIEEQSSSQDGPPAKPIVIENITVSES